MNLKSKNLIIIFGASGGIGLEIAKNLYEQGYNLILTYNKNLKKIKKNFSIKKINNNIYFINCNFRNEQSIKNVINVAIKKNLKIKSVINCVGVFYYETLNDFSYKSIIDTFKINTFSTLAINKYLYNLKKKSKSLTKIISIGSSSSLNGFKDTFSYCGSKHALLGIIRSLNESLYKKKILNYCLNLGSIKNKMGKKVRSNEFKNFIPTQQVVKALNFILNLELPAFSEEIFIKRMKY